MITELELKESFEATLLHNLCHLVHTAAGCTAAASASAVAQSKLSKVAAFVSQPPATPQVVLSSTWRLESKALSIVQTLMERLQLIKPIEHNSAAMSAASSASAHVAGAASSSSSSSTNGAVLPCSCELRHLRALECTPDLEGWGTRLEEICCYLRDYCMAGHDDTQSGGSSSHCAGSSVAAAAAVSSPRLRPCPRFLIVDDMELYGALNLHRGPRVGRIALFDGCRARTLKTEGTQGLDARALGVGMGLVAREAAPAAAFVTDLAAFRVTKPGEEEEEAETEAAPAALQLGPSASASAAVAAVPAPAAT